MLKSLMKSAAVASLLMLAAGVASSATLSLRYDGPTVGSYAGVTFISAPVDPYGSANTAGAVGFNMSSLAPDGGVIDTFVAWCLDIEHRLGGKGTPKSYSTTSTPFANSYGLDESMLKRVQSVFDANYKGVDVTNKYAAAGFQVALWNALYDTDWVAEAGIFDVESESGVIASANSFLKAASLYSGARMWNLTFLESNSGNQNLVTVSPVPLPAGAGLLILALGGLAAAGRRRRAA